MGKTIRIELDYEKLIENIEYELNWEYADEMVIYLKKPSYIELKFTAEGCIESNEIDYLELICRKHGGRLGYFRATPLDEWTLLMTIRVYIVGKNEENDKEGEKDDRK